MAVGTLGSQACVYVLSVLATRTLGPSGYGELASLLTLTVILSIPALSLQSWTARTTALGGDPRSVLPTTTRLSIGAALATAAVTLVAAPRLDTDPVPAAITAALLVGPLVWLAAAQGFLQGARRLRPFALVILLSGAARLAGGYAGLRFGVGAWPVVWGIGLATVPVAGLAWALALHQTPTNRTRPAWGPLVRITAATGAIWALANVDVVVARTSLSNHESGLYAAGALVIRAVMFAPQFVTMSSFAALTDARRSQRLLVVAAGKVAAIGVTAAAVLAVVGPWLVPAFLGQEFASIGEEAWVFAIVGTMLALNQLIVAQRIARHDEASATVLWLAAAALVAVVATWLHGSVLEVAIAGLLVNAVVLAVLAGRAVSRP